MPSSNFQRFAVKLNRLGKLLGFTQVELARRLGMQPSHLNIFLRGRSDIHSERLIELLSELGISVERLVDEALDKRLRTSQSEEEDIAMSLQSISRSERKSLTQIISQLRRKVC